MSLQITTTRQATPTEWESIWQACDYATFFHSPIWIDVWAKYRGHQFYEKAQYIQFSDGVEIVIPTLCRVRLAGLIKSYQLSPAGTFGGWISRHTLTADHEKLIVKFLLTHLKTFSWRHNPLVSSSNEALKFATVTDDETDIIDLEPGIDAIFKSWTKGHKSAAKKAAREGVTMRLADGRDDWQCYYAIYKESVERWGDQATTVYDWRLFELFHDANSNDIKLWLAIYDNKPIAGALCLYAKQHVVYWHGAALSDFFKLRPVHLLIWRIVETCCAQGKRWFDFNPSAGLKGVKAFKKSFGTQQLPCPVVESASPLVQFLRRLRQHIQ